MALTRVQAIPEAKGNSSTITLTGFPSAPTVGNAIVVPLLYWGGATSGATSCSDNQGNTYAAATTLLSNSNAKLIIYYCSRITATGTPFTITITGGSYYVATAIEVTGLSGNDLVVDAAATASGNSTTPATGSTAALSANDAFLLAGYAYDISLSSSVVQSVTPAWFEEIEDLSWSWAVGEADTRSLTTASGTTQSCTWTLSGSSASWVAALVAFKASGAAAATAGRVTQLVAETVSALAASVVDGRVTQVVAETLTREVGARLSQLVAETLSPVPPAPLRVSQSPLELVDQYPTEVRVSQTTVENAQQWTAPLVGARLSQALLEIIYPFGCYVYIPPLSPPMVRPVPPSGKIHYYGYSVRRTVPERGEPLGLAPGSRLDVRVGGSPEAQLLGVKAESTQPLGNPFVADRDGYFSTYVVPAPIDHQIQDTDVSQYTLLDALVLDPRVGDLTNRVAALIRARAGLPAWSVTSPPPQMTPTTVASQFGYAVGFTSTSYTGLVGPSFPLIQIDTVSLRMVPTSGEVALGPGLTAPMTIELYLDKNGTPISTHSDTWLYATQDSSTSPGTTNWAPFQTLELELTMSSRNDDFSINPDGMARVYLNGTKIIDVANLTIGNGTAWRELYIACLGFMASLYVRDVPQRWPGYGRSYAAIPRSQYTWPGTLPFTGGLAPVSLPSPAVYALNFQGATDGQIFQTSGGFWKKKYGSNFDNAQTPNPPAYPCVGLMQGYLALTGGNIAFGQLYRLNPSTPPNIYVPPPVPPPLVRPVPPSGKIHYYGYTFRRTAPATGASLGLAPGARLDVRVGGVPEAQLLGVKAESTQPLGNPFVADRDGYFSMYVVPRPLDHQIHDDADVLPYTISDALVLDPRVQDLTNRVAALILARTGG